MKIILPIIVALVLNACAQNQQAPRSYGNDMLPAGHPVGNDALPSAEVIAFQKADSRLKYGNARIEHDDSSCALYQGTAPDGQVKREPLLDGAGKPICARR